VDERSPVLVRLGHMPQRGDLAGAQGNYRCMPGMAVQPMSATLVMLLAVILYVIARWARNEPAVNLPVILSGAFAIGIIAFLDSFSRTEQIAKGFAWLFLVTAAYVAIPGFTGAIKSAQGGARKGVQAVRNPPGQFT
jgi:hypothetical protein